MNLAPWIGEILINLGPRHLSTKFRGGGDRPRLIRARLGKRARAILTVRESSQYVYQNELDAR